MDHNKLVSVIMSVYNEKKEWLIQAIESILNQSYENLELIIILDNPDNNLLKNVIMGYSEIDKRIKFYQNTENKGLIWSLNFALKYASGYYIARMDADDISDIGRIQKQVEDLENNNYDLVASAMCFIDEDDNVTGTSGCYGKNASVCEKSLALRNILPHPTWLTKASVFDKVGDYHLVPTTEDYEWLCRAQCMGMKMHCMDEVLHKYRIRDSGICVGKAYQQMRISKIVRKEYCSALKARRMFEYDNILPLISKVDMSQKHNRYDKSAAIYKKGCSELKNGNKLAATMKIIRAFVMSPAHLGHFMDTIKLKKINKGAER